MVPHGQIERVDLLHAVLHDFSAGSLGFRNQLLYINVQRFRGGLVFKAHRLCVSLNSRLESGNEEEGSEIVERSIFCGEFRVQGAGFRVQGAGLGFRVQGSGLGFRV